MPCKFVAKGRESRNSSISSIVLSGLTLVALCGASSAQQAVSTYHGNNLRTGQATDQTILIPANVNSTRFGKLFSYAADGMIVGEPLYVPNVTMSDGRTHNVVYAATQHDSVYAFDADNPGSGAPLWQANFLNPGAGVTSVPISAQKCAGSGFSEVGIMGTPVIDLSTGTIYVSAKTQETSGSTVTYVHRLHALDIATGAEKFGGPVVILPNGQTTEFNTLSQCQRPGLLLANGTLFIAYGSNGCDFSHGWLLAYDPISLQQLAAFNTAPNSSWGANIWMAGSGLAADANGSIYFSTANGLFDANTGGPDYGDTVMKLQYASGAFTVADYFTPHDQLRMDNNDLDLGSGGVTLLPDQSGNVSHELITSGKTGTIYVLNRDDMGQYNSQNDNQIVQTIPGALGPFYSIPVYWNNLVYFASYSDSVKAFSLNNGQLSWSPVAQSFRYAQVGLPTISSSGNTNGIFWNIHNPATPVLSALDGITLAEMYNSNQKTSRDALGMVAHFATPTIANNKVFVGTQSSLNVYGVFPFLTLLVGNSQSGAAGTTLSSPIAVQATDSQGNGVPGVAVTFSATVSGGSFSSPTAVTDSTGTATTTYTLPTKATSVGITVAATGFRGLSLSELGLPGPAAAMAKISGLGQTGTAGTVLPQPLVFKLADKYNNPIAGQAVSFTDTAPHGVFSATSLITNSVGQVSVIYTLPTSTLPSSSRQTLVTATGSGLSATMGFLNRSGAATAMSTALGNNQAQKAGTQLKTLLTVFVSDQYGNPVSGVTVTYSDGGVGGTFSSTTANTNNVGNAFVSYTLPSTPQVVNVTASASGVPNVNFTETAQ